MMTVINEIIKRKITKKTTFGMKNSRTTMWLWSINKLWNISNDENIFFRQTIGEYQEKKKKVLYEWIILPIRSKQICCESMRLQKEEKKRVRIELMSHWAASSSLTSLAWQAMRVELEQSRTDNIHAIGFFFSMVDLSNHSRHRSLFMRNNRNSSIRKTFIVDELNRENLSENL